MAFERSLYIARRAQAVILVLGLMALTACAETSLLSHMAKQMPVDLGPEVQALGNLAHPHRGGHYKVGLPYTIKGITYRPKVEYDYDEVGIASWYGPGFDGKLTANGEIYDQDLLTAAHKTLPMPSIVRVINLENGRSIVVRVNDRGPFAPGRIIDMSERGAKLLGFHRQGIAKVRVQILSEESRILAAAAQGKPVPRYTGMVLSKGAPGLPAPPLPKAKPIQAPVLAVTEPAPNPVPSARALLASWPGQDAVDTAGLYIQLAAFKDPVRADNARQRVGHLGPAGVYRADLAAGTYYRLRLGPLVDRAQADRLLAQVLRAGYPGARIIAD